LTCSKPSQKGGGNPVPAGVGGISVSEWAGKKGRRGEKKIQGSIGRRGVGIKFSLDMRVRGEGGISLNKKKGEKKKEKRLPGSGVPLSGFERFRGVRSVRLF